MIQQFDELQRTWQRLGTRPHGIKPLVKKAFVVLQRANRWVESLETCLENDQDDEPVETGHWTELELSDSGYQILERKKRNIVLNFTKK